MVFPPLVANTAVGMSLFGAYTAAEHLVPVSAWAPFAAGGIAGFTHSVVSHPIDTLKDRFDVRRMVLDRNGSVWAYVQREARKLGPRRLYRGWIGYCAKDTLGFSIFFGVFESVKRALKRHGIFAYPDRHRIERSANAAVAGVCSALTYHIVMTPLQHQSARDGKRWWVTPRGWRLVYRELGRNFFRTLLPTAAALVIYEMTLPEHVSEFYNDFFALRD